MSTLNEPGKWRILPGTYKINELSKLGWAPTTPTDISVSIKNSDISNLNFGNKLVVSPGTASIWGIKFNDISGDGINNGEPGLAGWKFELRNASDNTVIKTTTTDSQGWYGFSNLTQGVYKVNEILKTGWIQKTPSSGFYTINLFSGQNRLGVDFGNFNALPTNPTLIPNLLSPQKVGKSIIWTAKATDSDPLQFRFIVRVPSTSTAVRIDTGYSRNNEFTGIQLASHQENIL